MHEYYFERMTVWQESRSLTNDLYALTKTFPKEEEFYSKSQIRRSSSSVKCNIAEGQGRMTKKDQARFTNQAYSSLIELLNHLITANDLGYVDRFQLEKVRLSIDSIARQLIGLRNAQINKIK